MSERESYNPGEFCWVDLSVPDVYKASAFYCDLLGCTAVSAGPDAGGYGFFETRGKMIAGFGPVQSEHQPAAWAGYVRVEDADETVAKITEAGGNVIMGPMDLPMNAGRIVAFQDAEGAYINAIQQIEHAGAQLVNEVGTWTWNQLGTRDLDKASAFYGAVLGWDAVRAPEAPPDLPYLMWHVEGQRWEEGLAGLMEMDGAGMPAEVPPHWMVFFAVPNAQEAVDKTLAAGGQVTQPPMRVPVGTMAVLIDPQGAAFAILEPDYPEAR